MSIKRESTVERSHTNEKDWDKIREYCIKGKIVLPSGSPFVFFCKQAQLKPQAGWFICCKLKQNASAWKISLKMLESLASE